MDMHEVNEKTPKYVKIQNYILDAIQTGKYLPGSKLPTEKELSEKFSVSRITVNKALKELSVAGVLEGIRGSGTFVSNRPQAPLEASAFVSAIKFIPTERVRVHDVISFRLIQGPDLLLKKAGLGKEKADFYEIVLANKKNGKEMESVDYLYIPAAFVKDNILLTLDHLRSHFVFDYLEKQLGMSPKFMKIFVNTPLYPFLESVRQLLDGPSSMQMWCTDIYDADMRLLGAVYTIYPDMQQEIPLFTFAL